MYLMIQVSYNKDMQLSPWKICKLFSLKVSYLRLFNIIDVTHEININGYIHLQTWSNSWKRCIHFLPDQCCGLAREEVCTSDTKVWSPRTQVWRSTSIIYCLPSKRRFWQRRCTSYTAQQFYNNILKHKIILPVLLSCLLLSCIQDTVGISLKTL